MAEGRMLKKVISTSKKLADLKSDSARLLYTWLLPHLDVEGRFSADPKVVKGNVCPRLKMSIKKIEEYLIEMNEKGLIVLYEADGDVFLQFSKFKDFQILRKDREKDSIIPKPTAKSRSIPSEARRDSVGTTTKDKIREVKIREVNNKYEKKFIELWKTWPKEGKFKKDWCKKKFIALCKAGKLKDFIATQRGYINFLEYQAKEKNFSQRAMHLSTFLNNWEGEKKYIGFEYKAGL